MTIPNSTDGKRCPFLGDTCIGTHCALYLAGYRVCAITFNAVVNGDTLGLTEKLTRR
ncbi:hypothetical protein [Treponema phagedenis]|uniref:hypothetical protein n=1 Tax=Treponema phagedenis TaxID=162 RepID=UPI0015A1D33F|nr:hypothetical protein [Treponema phagedenis]NVP23611.1 hypothetical protein [Treponema phagedenis]QLC58442.1 hypothetical protein HW453_06170 [Treponema phagedenis]